MSDVSSLPIDIHCSKLSEWLQSRRHCTKDWQKIALNIRSKISSAMQDMPEHPEVLEMLSGAYINYFHCLRIVQILKQTDSSSKNFFGRYSSQRVNDWQEITNLYEKDNVYLSESAQLLHQYTQYEIPALKKQLARCQVTVEECDRKECEYEQLSVESEKAFKQECLKMGLVGENLKQELVHLSDNLSGFFDDILNDVENLAPAVEFYDSFRRSTLGHRNSADFSAPLTLPNLKFIKDKRNVTVFEWKRGFAPDSVERMSVKLDPDNNVDSSDTIDFGESEIDFGDNSAADEAKFDSICIEEVGEGEEKCDGMSSTKDNVARLDEALTLLENTDFVQLLHCDLSEIRAFLVIRKLELTRQGAASDAYSVLDTSLNESIDKISIFLDQVNSLIKKLHDERTKNLLKLRTSPVYLQKILEKLMEPRKQAERFLRLKSFADQRASETKEKSVEVQAQLDVLVKRAQELQKRIEEDISKRYQNRPVNIVGSTAVVKN